MAANINVREDLLEQLEEVDAPDEDEFDTDEYSRQNDEYVTQSYLWLERCRNESQCQPPNNLPNYPAASAAAVHPSNVPPQGVIQSQPDFQSTTQEEASGAEDRNLEEYDEILIDCVKNYRIIWGTSGPGYKDTEKKNSAWSEISKHLNIECKLVSL